MGFFDVYNELRVTSPAMPVTPAKLIADVEKRQRGDDRAMVPRAQALALPPGVRGFSAAWGVAGTGSAGTLTLTDTQNCTEADDDEAILPVWRGVYAINVTMEVSDGSAEFVATLWPSGSTSGALFTVGGGTGSTCANSLFLRLDPNGTGLGLVAEATGVAGAWTGSVWAVGYLLGT
jgi:hypothetical protein